MPNAAAQAGSVITRVEALIRQELCDEESAASLSGKLLQLSDGIRRQEEIKRVIGSVEQVIDEVENPLMRSMIVLENNLIGEFDHRRCRVVCDKEELYLDPKEYFIKGQEEVDTTGCPSQEKTRADYFEALNRYGEQQENPDWIVDELLSSPALNIPGRHEVEGVRLTTQVEADIGRLSSLLVDGVSLYSNVNDPVSIFRRLVESVQGEAELAGHLAKLITQASLAGPCYRLQMKVLNPKLLVFFQTIDHSIAIRTQDLSGAAGSTIVLKDMISFALTDCASDTQEPLGYFKFIRLIELDREKLKQGLSRGASVHDTYSQYYQTKEAMEAFCVEEPSVRPAPRGCVLC